MPWSCCFLLQHHQTNKKIDLMLKLFIKYMPRWENPHNSIILHLCVVKMDLWSKCSKFSNFKHLKKINECTEWSKFPSELCFGNMNTTKDSYLLNSKLASLKRGQNAAGICPFFYGAFGQKIAKQSQLWISVIGIVKAAIF